MILTWCPYIETIVFVHPIYIFAYRLTTLKKINFALVCVCVFAPVSGDVYCVWQRIKANIFVRRITLELHLSAELKSTRKKLYEPN